MQVQGSFSLMKNTSLSNNFGRVYSNTFLCVAEGDCTQNNKLAVARSSLCLQWWDKMEEKRFGNIQRLLATVITY